MSRLTTFEEAFSCRVGSCRGQCACGKEYYNPDTCWDFGEGEIESLKNSGAVEIDYSVGYIEFNGATYVDACDCWNQEATRVMNFLDIYAAQIADYINNERQRKIAEASSVPEVSHEPR